MKLFAHSRLDSLLLLVALVQLGVVTFGTLSIGAVHWGVSVALGVLATFLVITNFQCVAHNFIHNPFFRRAELNRAFAVLNSLLIGNPQSLYRVHHLHHHKYNNDAPDPVDGTTRDITSTWRYSRRPGYEESFLRYALLGYFRTDFGYLVKEASRKGLLPMVIAEAVALAAFVLILGALNPLGLAVFFVPVWLVGNIGAVAENYLEHYGAFPGDRRTDSVSSYGGVYNLIWFNNGYHQEHHFRPQVHWSRVAELKKQPPPEHARRVVRGAHWLNVRPRERPYHP